jgi:hypothetical protein
MRPISRKHLQECDTWLISFVKRISAPFARIALFIVFFWFGLLKIIYTSPANSLISALLEKTMPFIAFDQFIVLLGIYEMTIGAAFLFSRLERLAMILLLPHMLLTFLPLVLLIDISWQSFFVPTLEGQYIIKNLAIIALALGTAVHLHPLVSHHAHRKR